MTLAFFLSSSFFFFFFNRSKGTPENNDRRIAVRYHFWNDYEKVIKPNHRRVSSHALNPKVINRILVVTMTLRFGSNTAGWRVKNCENRPTSLSPPFLSPDTQAPMSLEIEMHSFNLVKIF